MKALNVCMLAAAMMVCCTVAKAEQTDYDNKHEVALSYGCLSNSSFLSVYEDMLNILVTAGHGYLDDKAFIGPIGVEYFYRLNKVFSVGGIGVFAMQNKDIMVEHSGLDQKIGSAHEYFYTIMPAVKADWLRRPHFGLYSKLALGTTIYNERQKYDDGQKQNDAAATVAWQASVIGLEAGGSHLRGFAEFGMGEQGVALFGIRYKF